MKVQRTFGWIQNPASTDNLKNVVGIFLKDSDINNNLILKKIPFLIEHNLVADKKIFMDYITLLSQKDIEISYNDLKGKGGDRQTAKCSGIAQAVIEAQKFITIDNQKIKKPYCDDWTADGFLRWAISIGFLVYNKDTDKCKISQSGIAFVLAKTAQESNQILGKAYLSYPPTVRILSLLKENKHMTKFEIGSQLGFIGEAGFTTIPQNLWAASYVNEQDPKLKNKIRSDEEGSSDKYARMICSWLCNIGWVIKVPKQVNEIYGNQKIICEIGQSYMITLQGLNNLNRAYGSSKHKQIPKIVFFEMLATKASSANYIRLRRAYIIKYITKKYRSIKEIQEYLNNKNLNENHTTIEDDITGLIQIGLNIQCRDKTYKLNDTIVNLEIPIQTYSISKDNIDLIKDRVRSKLKKLNHKYLVLIDLAFGGKNSNREFEIQTIDLFTNELLYQGKRLGDTRKPDSVIYYNTNGVIIDNKAYSEGYSLPRSQVDEMIRYIQENNDRNISRNPNQWWSEFPASVKSFNYLFISSLFKGNFKERLKEIYASTKINGAVINIENLLYLAEQIKTGKISYPDTFKLFNINNEVVINSN